MLLGSSQRQTGFKNTTIDGDNIYDVELVAKAKYIYSIQEITIWYWQKQILQHTIIVLTCTILHPRLDGAEITDIQDVPKSVCNKIQGKKAIQRYTICLTDTDYDYI